MPHHKTAAERFAEKNGDAKKTRRKSQQPRSDDVSGSRPWPQPIPLGQMPEVPPFPVLWLPGWLRRWVEAEAESTQTPPDLAGMLALAICGAGVAKRYIVLIRPGWVEPVNLLVAVALLPGERKSAVFRDASGPVLELEREEVERTTADIARAAADHRILEARLKQAEQRAGKEANALKRQQAIQDARDLAAELAVHVVPPTPQFVCDDITPERLTSLLIRQGGRMLQAAAEGTAFEIIKGRYSETANYDIYLKGHSGDPLRVDRTGRDGERDDRPALSVAVAVQPDVLRGLAENASMRGRGFLARWLYSIPRSLVGSRRIAPPPVTRHLAAEYREGLRTLWTSTRIVDDGGRPVPRELRFNKEADKVLQQFEAELEPRLAEGEDLSFLAGWGQKLAGAVARISAILHIVQAVEDGSSWEAPIRPDTVQTAARFGLEYLLPHAQAAFGLMATDPTMETARAVWETICKRVCEHSAHSESASQGPTVTRRDIHQWSRRRFNQAKDADPVLEILERHHLIRPQPQVGQPGRGHPSPSYEINPAALDEFRMAEERSHCTHCTHS
jgi:hypothetical protein